MPQLQENKKKLIVNEALEESGLRGITQKINRVALSSGFLQPGDIVILNYRKDHETYYKPVVVLVVQTKVSSGVRISRGTNRKLITCFKLDNSPEAMNMVRKLYNNKSNSSYLKVYSMMGEDQYRTYIMDSSHVSRILKVKLDETALNKTQTEASQVEG